MCQRGAHSEPKTLALERLSVWRFDALISTRASQGTARAALATSIDALVSACGARGMPRAALVASRALRRSTESISRCDDGRSRFDESRSRRLLRGGQSRRASPGVSREAPSVYRQSLSVATALSLQRGRARRRECDKNVRLGGDRLDSAPRLAHAGTDRSLRAEALGNPRAALGTSRASVALARARSALLAGRSALPARLCAGFRHRSS